MFGVVQTGQNICLSRRKSGLYVVGPGGSSTPPTPIDPVTDTFSVDGPLTTTETGQNYEFYGDVTWEAQSGKAVITGGTEGQAAVDIGGNTNFAIEAVIEFDAVNNNVPGLVFWLDPDTGNSIGFLASPSGGVAVLINTETGDILGFGALGTSGSLYRVEVSPAHIRCLINGVQVIQIANSLHLPYTRAGFYWAQGGGIGADSWASLRIEAL